MANIHQPSKTVKNLRQQRTQTLTLIWILKNIKLMFKVKPCYSSILKEMLPLLRLEEGLHFVINCSLPTSRAG